MLKRAKVRTSQKYRIYRLVRDTYFLEKKKVRTGQNLE